MNVLVLHNIRSAHNVGSIFRTADAAGIDMVYLTGYTPAPQDRFGRPRKEIAKTSLGADAFVRWEHVARPSEVIKKLKKSGYYIVGIEQDENSIPYTHVQTKQKTAFIVGNEVRGISKQILSLCDIVAEIPMHGQKESLNVSVATGVAVFRILENVSTKKQAPNSK